uniref:Niban apoptosis regulator 1 n=1 Tax=Sphenodon punctatus TaxID=8508 RepID=A0A8D0LBY2_SPHPU
MGGSASSLLDESKCSYVRGKTEAVIKNFSPHYKRQYAVAFCQHIQNELDQNRDSQSQFLKTKPLMESDLTLYEAELSHFADDLKKWKDRYIVIKNDYAVESFESREAYQKGISPKSSILPVGGKVLTAEEDYNVLSDKHFPDPIASSEKENAQAFVLLPKEFPVYLWQPYLRHSYFCFQDPESQKRFSTTLNDCARHLNHDFLKQTSFEAQAFLEAVQFFRQEKGQYGAWEMIIGNEIQILSNLVMEELLPNFQTMILPKMKGKRNDRKRSWFGIVEETYNLVQEQVSEGLSTLKEECKDQTKCLEGTIRSDMDQIVNSKNFLAGKIKATVSEPAQKCCMENIQPFLASILEELMGPVSSGFSEVRSLFEKEVDELSQNFQKTKDTTKLKENLNQLMNLPFNSVKMEPCYLKVNLLQEQLQDLKSRFKFYHIDFVIQRTQNFMQELMENAVYTFEQLLNLSWQEHATKMVTSIEKVKLRVLKQYDYDSSTIRKKIFQEVLVQITLPTMQKTLASTCKPELQKYEQYIFADYTSVIQVENVYEEILLQTLLDETLKVIKEAAVLKKHNLFEDNINLPCESISSLTDLKTPSGSAQASPAKKPSTNLTEMSDTETQSNKVLVTGNVTQNKCPDGEKSSENGGEISTDVSIVPGSAREEVIIPDLTDRQKSIPLAIKEEEAVEEKISSQHASAVESGFVVAAEKENKALAEEEALTAPDSVNEIRSLVTVEILADVSQEYKDEVVNENEILKMQEYGADRNENDKTNAEEGPADRVEDKEEKLAEPEAVSQPAEPEVVTLLLRPEAVDLPVEPGVVEPKVLVQPTEPEVLALPVEPELVSLPVKSQVLEPKMVVQPAEPKMVGLPMEFEEVESKEVVQYVEPKVVVLPEEPEAVVLLEECEVMAHEVMDLLVEPEPVEPQAEAQPFPLSFETDSINISEVISHVVQEECLEISEEPEVLHKSRAEVETNQSIWYTDVEGCLGLDNQTPKQHHAEGTAGDGKSDLEGVGLGSSYAFPVEVGPESFSGGSVESSEKTQVSVFGIAHLRIETTDLPVSLEVSAREEEVSTTEATVDVKSESSAATDRDENNQTGAPSPSAETTSMVGNETITQENTVGSCIEQCSAE